MKSDKRKHARVRHRDTVELVSGTGTFSGTSVNVSMSGMQVVVRMPESYDSVQSIAFQLPGSGERVQLSCRLIRNSEHDAEGDQTLGIEFLSEDDAQLLLIERFIQDRRVDRDDARQLPRISCHLDDVTVEGRDIQAVSIDNLSTEGLLLNFHGEVAYGEVLDLSVGVPGDARRLHLGGTVVYVVENAFQGSFTAGLRLSRMKETEEARLRNLIVSCSSSAAMRDLHLHLDARTTEPESRISDPLLIGGILNSLNAECVRLSALMDGTFTILEHEIDCVEQGRARFSMRFDHELAGVRLLAGHSAYFAFYWKKGSYYFKTAIESVHEDLVRFQLPPLIFRSNKRSYQRKPLQESRVTIRIPGDPARRSFDAALVDISRRGFLCALRLPPEDQSLFRQGASISYVVDERLGLGAEGQIRHLKAHTTADGVALHLGVEAGIGRSTARHSRVHAEKWEEEKSREDRRDPGRRIESHLVRFRDDAGRQICGIVNATRLHAAAPVVIIPSSYGKKKEAFSPLVATLLATFWNEGKDVVTLRYDGVNRPGESHQDDPQAKRGYEMLSYRISQGLSDLKAALHFARTTPLFTAEKIILVSFSMSSIDARRLLSQEPGAVDYWINVMGVPCGQTTLRNILGGIDVISNYRLGVPNGVIGLLGHLIDMDALATDVVEKKYAFLTDARHDMSRIPIPILWIYGLYDKWVDIDEVKDLMSVKAAGSREVLEIPTGHNLRTSDDAIQTFKRVAGSIFQNLWNREVAPTNPSREEMIHLLTEERERLENRTAPSLKEYWREYLVGNERNAVGYDFYRNIPEFAEFLRTQAGCLSLGHDEVIADMGCGTGIFLEQLLGFISSSGNGVSVREITAVDLVQDALDRARAKCERAVAADPRLGAIRFRYVARNLEPNRLLPVSHFIAADAPSLESLRNRIEGLSGAVLDGLIGKASPSLHAFMRGDARNGSLLAQMESSLDATELRAVRDFNLAARFLRNSLTEEDIQLGRRGAGTDARGLRTTDLAFETLSFGDNGSALSIGFADASFTRIVASLFISYVLNPDYVLSEFYRMLKPGGLLLVSSMKPDSDVGTMFTNYINKLQNGRCPEQDKAGATEGADGARAMLNEAAHLCELEEDGYFRFYTADELRFLLEEAGFTNIAIRASMANPPQAHIAVAAKPLTPPSFPP